MPAQHNPDLRQLAQVLAVVDAGSIAAAARALGIAQPALSRRLRDLEASIGCQLFAREGNGARPTAAGLVLAEGARTLLAARDALMDETRRRGEGETGTLTIGFNETVSWGGVVPDVIRRFRASHADVNLVSLPMNSATARAALAEERVALGFMFGRPLNDPTFAALNVSIEPVTLAVHRDDDLAALDEPVPLEALAGASLIWFHREASPAYHDQVLAALAAAGLAAEPVQVTSNTSAMLALVNAGAGYTFVPAAAVMRKPADVVLKSLARPDLDQRLELVWRADDRDALTRRFVDCARSVLARKGDGG